MGKKLPPVIPTVNLNWEKKLPLNNQDTFTKSHKCNLYQVRLMHEAGYELGNLDATLILQEPKLSLHKEPIHREPQSEHPWEGWQSRGESQYCCSTLLFFWWGNEVSSILWEWEGNMRLAPNYIYWYILILFLYTEPTYIGWNYASRALVSVHHETRN